MAVDTPSRPVPAPPAAIPARPFPAPPDPTGPVLQREYVAGGTARGYGTTAQSLPVAIDDITSDFGDDLYDRMLRDPQVAATIAIFKASILEEGLQLSPAIQDKDDPDYDLAVEILDEAEDMLLDLETPLDDVLWNLLDCVAFGNKVAEQIHRFEPAKKDGRTILRLNALKVKTRHSFLFVVDQFDNLVGLIARIPGMQEAPPSGIVSYSPALFARNTDGQPDVPNLLSIHKFAIAQFRPRDGDPRGVSLLRAAYEPWWRKRQILPEYLKYLAQFAGPSLIGKCAPNAQPTVSYDTAGNQLKLTPEDLFLAALQQFHNGTVLAIPNGADVVPIQMLGDGAAFRLALAHCDQQITKGVLTQELATEQSKNQARAAAEVHQDVLDTLIRQAKRSVAGMLRRQVLQRWVLFNWGERARRLTPLTRLGITERRDLPGLWQAIGTLQNSGYIAPSQKQAIDALIGLPIRDGDEVALEVETQEVALDQARAQVAQTEALAQPAAPAAPQPSSPDRVLVQPHERAKPQRRSPDDGKGESTGDSKGEVRRGDGKFAGREKEDPKS